MSSSASNANRNGGRCRSSASTGPEIRGSGALIPGLLRCPCLRLPDGPLPLRSRLRLPRSRLSRAFIRLSTLAPGPRPDGAHRRLHGGMRKSNRGTILVSDGRPSKRRPPARSPPGRRRARAMHGSGSPVHFAVREAPSPTEPRSPSMHRRRTQARPRQPAALTLAVSILLAGCAATTVPPSDRGPRLAAAAEAFGGRFDYVLRSEQGQAGRRGVPRDVAGGRPHRNRPRPRLSGWLRRKRKPSG